MEEQVPDPVFRNFIKRVLKLHERDYDIQYEGLPDIPHSDPDEIRYDTVQLFARALFYQSSVSYVAWREFLDNYAPEITRNPRDYVSTVMYMCRRVRQGTILPNTKDKKANVLEKFISIIATVCGAARFYWKRYRKSYFKYTAAILIVFFEYEFRDAFYTEREKVWDNLFEFLCAQLYLKWGDSSFQKYSRNTYKSAYITALEKEVSETHYYSAVRYVVPQDVLSDRRSLYLCDVVIESFVMSSLLEAAKKFWRDAENDEINMIVLDKTEFNQRELPADILDISFDDSDEDPIMEPISEVDMGLKLINKARVIAHFAGFSAEMAKSCASALGSSE